MTLPVEDYKENIETVFDMSIEEFLAKAADNTDIKFCLADPSTGEWSDMGENYTANAPGYWMNTQVVRLSVGERTVMPPTLNITVVMKLAE